MWPREDFHTQPFDLSFDQADETIQHVSVSCVFTVSELVLQLFSSLMKC
jgi:hypothetical protein